MTVLAIDQGTSGTKALVVGDDAEVLAHAEREVRPTYLPGGGVEVDPHQLLASVLEAGREAVELSRSTPTVVALANQGETVLAWDRRSGQPLGPAIVWQDRRSQAVCDSLGALAPELTALTGLQLDPYFSAPKMVWIRDHLTREGVVTTTDVWLLNQLCGAYVTDVSTASRSMLMDIDTRRWDPRCVAAFGLSGEALPEIVGCDRRVGATTAFGTSMEVGGLIVDQAAALLAQRCIEGGQAKCTFGTGAFLLVNCGASPVRSSAGLTTSVAWQIGSDVRYYMDGQVYAAGSAVRWLHSTGLLSATDRLDAEAADDSGGVICVPSLAGLAAPWWQPEASATIAGLHLSSGAGQVVTAVLEGVAAQLAAVADAVASDMDRPIEALRVDGGLTASRRLMQAVADVTQMPVVVSARPHATAEGAALLGLLSLEAPAGLGDLLAGRSASESVYEPVWSADRARTYRSRWARLAVGAGAGS